MSEPRLSPIERTILKVLLDAEHADATLDMKALNALVHARRSTVVTHPSTLTVMTHVRRLASFSMVSVRDSTVALRLRGRLRALSARTAHE